MQFIKSHTPGFKVIRSLSCLDLLAFETQARKANKRMYEAAFVPVPCGQWARAVYKDGELSKLRIRNGDSISTSEIHDLPQKVKHLSKHASIIGIVSETGFHYLFNDTSVAVNKDCYSKLDREYEAATRDGFDCEFIRFKINNRLAMLNRELEHYKDKEQSLRAAGSGFKASWFAGLAQGVHEIKNEHLRERMRIIERMRSNCAVQGWLLLPTSQKVRHSLQYENRHEEMAFYYDTLSARAK